VDGMGEVRPLDGPSWVGEAGEIRGVEAMLKRGENL